MSIDVEALGRAMHIRLGHSNKYGNGQCRCWGEARAIAAEYACLVPAEDGPTEPCPTCMQPVYVPQRGDHDYGIPLVPAEGEGPYLTQREQGRLVCGTCSCPFTKHTEYGCKPHGMHEFRRAYKPAEDEGRLREAALEVLTRWEQYAVGDFEVAPRPEDFARLRAALAATPEPRT